MNPAFDLVCIGRTCVDLYAEQEGAKLEDVQSFRKYVGGSAANIALNTARLGVKTAMLNDPAVGGLRIDVDTFKGAVTLSGRVKSEAERQQAIALARGINGVTQVKDALQVIPEGQ